MIANTTSKTAEDLSKIIDLQKSNFLEKLKSQQPIYLQEQLIKGSALKKSTRTMTVKKQLGLLWFWIGMA